MRAPEIALLHALLHTAPGTQSRAPPRFWKVPVACYFFGRADRI